MNFIQQAYKGKNEWYHYFATILIVFIGWQIIGVLPLFTTAVMYSSDMGEFMTAANTGFTSLGIDKNLFLFLMIITFVFGLVGLLLSVKFVHKRPVKTLITSRDKIDWKRFWFGFLLWGFIAGIVTLSDVFISPEDFISNFKPIPFFTLLLVAILFLPFQTSFEELLFRGYLMQGFGTWFKNRWLPLIITSVIFGLLHGANPEVEKLGYISMVFYIGTGLLFGITTLMDEGTELALGLHAANNIIAAILVTTDWTAFQTDALYIDTSEPSVGFEMFFPVLILYPVLLLIFSKKYGWTNWKDKLIGTIKKPNTGSEETFS
ncbi:CPBP family intramembrane glutamic endopeptidase [Tenacibaculum geojense]|uniref:CPBP family intramembrane glutamic endopeptidase n=1 Tax=Tenacibaculum geojense TaxID=915352 RepID=A0ABW3JSD4_9FLAO